MRHDCLGNLDQAKFMAKHFIKDMIECAINDPENRTQIIEACNKKIDNHKPKPKKYTKALLDLTKTWAPIDYNPNRNQFPPFESLLHLPPIGKSRAFFTVRDGLQRYITNFINNNIIIILNHLTDDQLKKRLTLLKTHLIGQLRNNKGFKKLKHWANQYNETLKTFCIKMTANFIDSQYIALFNTKNPRPVPINETPPIPITTQVSQFSLFYHPPSAPEQPLVIAPCPAEPQPDLMLSAESMEEGVSFSFNQQENPPPNFPYSFFDTPSPLSSPDRVTLLSTCYQT